MRRELENLCLQYNADQDARIRQTGRAMHVSRHATQAEMEAEQSQAKIKSKHGTAATISK